MRFPGSGTHCLTSIWTRTQEHPEFDGRRINHIAELGGALKPAWPTRMLHYEAVYFS